MKDEADFCFATWLLCYSKAFNTT